MRALVSHRPGGPSSLELANCPDPIAGVGEIVVEVRACGVNFPDSLIIEDKYQYKPVRPFSPGAEIAGTVIAIGPEVSGFSIGDRVMAMCGWGGMAEQIALSAEICHPMPPEMSFEEGAAFLMTFGTSYHALKQRGRIQPGERLLVLGASGGVGLAAVALGRAMGASVIAAVSSQSKLDVALSQGAQFGFVYPAGDCATDQKALNAFIKESTGQVDVVFDPVGGPFSEAVVRALSWRGRYLIVGFPAGITRLPLNLLLLKGASAVGVFYGSFTEREKDLNLQNNRELVDLYRAGKIRPLISQRFELEQGGDAIRELSSRRAVGKLVVTIDEHRS